MLRFFVEMVNKIRFCLIQPKSAVYFNGTVPDNDAQLVTQTMTPTPSSKPKKWPQAQLLAQTTTPKWTQEKRRWTREEEDVDYRGKKTEDMFVNGKWHCNSQSIELVKNYLQIMQDEKK